VNHVRRGNQEEVHGGSSLQPVRERERAPLRRSRVAERKEGGGGACRVVWGGGPSWQHRLRPSGARRCACYAGAGEKRGGVRARGPATGPA
jgi:hypothetical protein